MFKKRFDQLKKVVDGCCFSTHTEIIDSEEALKMAHFLLSQIAKVEGMVYVIGNGGSATIASHFCTDLLRTLELSAVTFSDSSILTCFANDYGYENVYKIPLMRNLKSQDLLVVISSSGKSANIVEAAQLARERKVPVISLTGFAANNPLRRLGDLNFWLDSHDYGLVEMGHAFLLHAIVDLYTHHKVKSFVSLHSSEITQNH